MKKATDTVLKQFGQNPSLLPNNVTLDVIYALLHFSLGNSYLEYNNNFFRQTIGGPMGSPLTVALAEVRITEIETIAINSCQKPPNIIGILSMTTLDSLPAKNTQMNSSSTLTLSHKTYSIIP